MIVPAHIMHAQRPSLINYYTTPPLSPSVRDPLWFRAKSYSHCARSLSRSQEKISRSPSIAQMSQEHQQVTSDIGSFNNNFSNNTGSHNNFNSFNTVNFITGLDNEGRQILQWLSPLEPQQRHQGVRTHRLDSVGNWVLETSDFRKWRDAEDGCVDQVLFCYGGPGVGKTYVR